MIKSLFRIILYVQDMDLMVRFYRDIIGLAVQSPAGLSDYSNEYWVAFETGGCILVLHGGGKKRLAQDTPKLNFLVDDIEATRQTLMDHGVAMGELFSPVPGTRVSNGVDPEGFPFSLDWHE